MLKQRKIYRLGTGILTENKEGLVLRRVGYPSFNAAKHANRGNCTPPNLKPKYARHFINVRAGART